MPLTPGTQLGQYEVVEPVGAGGMGEVYRARDTKLGRDVAIKVLPEAFAEDRERLDRFEREARLLAQLNHANVATLHGLEEEDGRQFLVMGKLVDGETLAERIRKGPIPVDEAIPLFIQIAEGLEAAHEKGIIHRDLKPANIKITPEGKVKILDFGLAKAFSEPEDVSAETSEPPTVTKGTALGAIVGTAAYMSPEQARAQAVDKRTDIWAFGCCLYEALTGDRAFGGAATADVLAAVLEREPGASSVPPALLWLVRRCLEKDPRQRLRDIGDARYELENPRTQTATPATPHRSRSIVAVSSGLSAFAAGLIVWSLARPPEAPRMTTRTTLQLPDIAPEGNAVFGFTLFQVAVSPDGRRVAYVAESDAGSEVRLRAFDQLSLLPIPNTEGASAVFFAPDGQALGFHANGKLKRVALDGSSVASLCQTDGFAGASWGDSGSIVFAARDGLHRVSARGGEPELIISPNPAQHESLMGWPELLPGGRSVLVTVLRQGSIVDDPRAEVVAISLDDGARKVVAKPGSNARFLRSGHVVYGWGGTLYVVGFDPSSLEVLGDPSPVVEGVRSDPFVGTGFAVSRASALVYAKAPTLGSLARLAWVNRAGQRSYVTDDKKPFRFPRLAPDGRAIAVAAGAPGNADVWVYDLEIDPPAALRLTSEGNNSVPIWSPDGNEVIFASTRDGPRNLYSLPADGSELEPKRLFESELPQHPLFVAPDSGDVVLYENHPERSFDIRAYDKTGTARSIVETKFFEGQGALSPNGQWLAFTSEREGDGYQIYVTPFQGDGGAARVSREGGTEPSWSAVGSTLFFTNKDQMLAVEIGERGGELTYGTPEPLFTGFLQGGGPRSYDVAHDGRFLVVVGEGSGSSRDTMVVVLDWFAELERLVPTEN